MIARMLELHEWEEFSKLFKEVIKHGPPSRTTCRIIVAEEAGEIVGFSVFNMVPHLEPVWVKEDCRGTTALMRMMRLADATFRPVTDLAMTHTTNPRVAEVLNFYGWEEMKTWQTFVWHKGA